VFDFEYITRAIHAHLTITLYTSCFLVITIVQSYLIDTFACVMSDSNPDLLKQNRVDALLHNINSLQCHQQRRRHRLLHLSFLTSLRNYLRSNSQAIKQKTDLGRSPHSHQHQPLRHRSYRLLLPLQVFTSPILHDVYYRPTTMNSS